MSCLLEAAGFRSSDCNDVVLRLSSIGDAETSGTFWLFLLVLNDVVLDAPCSRNRSSCIAENVGISANSNTATINQFFLKKNQIFKNEDYTNEIQINGE